MQNFMTHGQPLLEGGKINKAFDSGQSVPQPDPREAN